MMTPYVSVHACSDDALWGSSLKAGWLGGSSKPVCARAAQPKYTTCLIQPTPPEVTQICKGDEELDGSVDTSALWDLDTHPLCPLPAEQAATPTVVPHTDHSFFVLGDQAKGDDLERARARMLGGLRSLQQLGTPEGVDLQEDAAWVDMLRSGCPDPAAFVAGGLHRYAAVWKDYFLAAGNTSSAAKDVLRWVEKGYCLDFVDPEEEGQQRAPLFHKKKGIVTSMLASVLPPDQVAGHLTGSVPKPVRFPNHKSAVLYAEFARQEVASALRQGVIRVWGGSVAPTVVNGLLVVDDKAPKLRLCTNPMFVNLFLRRQPLKYDRIRDVADFIHPDDYLYTTDDKSGYWHVPIHPQFWKYLAFNLEGVDYCFTHMPFGIAPACWVYTTIKSELYRPFRAAGVRMSFLIDDQMGAACGKAAAKFQCRVITEIITSVGFTLSLGKCHLLPATSTLFLGTGVDAEGQRFTVPPHKVQRFLQLAEEVAAEPVATARLVASVAGIMMSMGHCVLLAPLFARAALKAAAGVTTWDEAFPAGTFQEAVGMFAGQLSISKGKGWRSQRQVLVVAGDASESQFAAFTPGGELDGPIIVPFSAAEQQRMASNRFSSTEREIAALLHTVKVLLRNRRDLIVGRRLVYQTDNQGNMYDVMGLKGGHSTFPLVKELHILCAESDVEIEVQWFPRNSSNQVIADELSKLVDDSEWLLNDGIYSRVVLGRLSVSGRQPTIDIFASAASSKVPGSFFSRYYCQGTSGVDAFNQQWARDSSTGQRHFAFINGPFDKYGAVLRKIEQEKVDCLLIAPDWPRAWVATLQQLRQRGVLKDSWQLPQVHDLLMPGPALPANKARPRAPRFRISCHLFLWDGI